MSILPDRISERKWCLERGRLTTKLLTLSNPSRHSNFEGSRYFSVENNTSCLPGIFKGDRGNVIPFRSKPCFFPQIFPFVCQNYSKMISSENLMITNYLMTINSQSKCYLVDNGPEITKMVFPSKTKNGLYLNQPLITTDSPQNSYKIDFYGKVTRKKV